MDVSIPASMKNALPRERLVRIEDGLVVNILLEYTQVCVDTRDQLQLEDELFFNQFSGRPIPYHYIRGLVKRINPRYQTHGLRIAGAEAAALAGLPAESLCALGGWATTSAMSLYVRNVATAGLNLSRSMGLTLNALYRTPQTI
jgi:hypothetical protein